MKKEFYGVTFHIWDNVTVTEGLIKRLKAWAVDCPGSEYIVKHTETHELVIL